MKKFIVYFLLFSAAAGVGFGQSVRSLGMGGVILPGPWASAYNPAYAAYPASTYGPNGGIGLPLGLINLALRPSISPVYYFTDFSTFEENFDFIAFYDQLTRPYEYIINPPRSPDEIVFHISADGISVTDENGEPLAIKYSAKATGSSGLPIKQPFFEIPIPTFTSWLHISIGAYVNAGGFGVEPSENLTADLAAGSLHANTTYSVSARAAAESGLTGRIAFASPLPRVPGFDGKVYLGGQVNGFYGLAYVDTTVTATTTTDSNAIPGEISYSSNIFYTYPGVGSGYGGRVDLGVVADYQSGTYGLGIRNLIGYEKWSGIQQTSDAGGTSETQKTISQTVFNPSIYVNGAYAQTLEKKGVVLYGADMKYENGALAAHAGLEYQKSVFRLRGGLGYEDGFKIGLGGGMALPHFSFDVAITSHQAPFTGQLTFGLASSLGFYF